MILSPNSILDQTLDGVSTAPVVKQDIHTALISVKERIAALDAALEAQLPGMSELLRTIHKQLKEDTELVTLISEEEIGTIVRGLHKQTNVVITSTKLKSEAKKRKTSLQLGLDL